MQAPLDVLLVGVGNRGRWPRDECAKPGAFFRPVDLCDIAPQFLAEAGERTGIPESACHTTFGEALARARAVCAILCTPTASHVEYARRRLAAGLYVLTEKGMAPTSDVERRVRAGRVRAGAAGTPDGRPEPPLQRPRTHPAAPHRRRRARLAAHRVPRLARDAARGGAGGVLGVHPGSNFGWTDIVGVPPDPAPGLTGLLADFHRCVTEGGEPGVSGFANLEVMARCELTARSCELGRTVIRVKLGNAVGT